MTRAIETFATVEGNRRLVLDESLPVPENTHVRVIVFVADEPEIDDREWLRQAAVSPAYRFLTDPAEDVYTVSDGKPFSDPR